MGRYKSLGIRVPSKGCSDRTSFFYAEGDEAPETRLDSSLIVLPVVQRPPDSTSIPEEGRRSDRAGGKRIFDGQVLCARHTDNVNMFENLFLGCFVAVAKDFLLLAFSSGGRSNPSALYTT